MPKLNTVICTYSESKYNDLHIHTIQVCISTSRTGDHDLDILENGIQLSVHKHISNTRLGTHLGYNHLHVLGMQIHESSLPVPVFLFGFWCAFDFTNLISGIDLPVGLLFVVCVSDSLLKRYFLDESSFWPRSDPGPLARVQGVRPVPPLQCN